MSDPEYSNIARLLARHAAERPGQDAVIVAATGQRVDYATLEARSNAIAHGLVSAGLQRGDRVCLFVPPSVELVAVAYALLKLGAVLVLADPGMGRKRLLACLERTAPRGFIGVPRAHAARKLFPRAFASVEVAVTVGRRLFWGGPTLRRIEEGQPTTFEPARTAADETAAILFTSGSTGPPKGVVHTHGAFVAQVAALGELYHFEPGEVDLCGFPPFALFDAAFGMTSVFPDLDPSRPAACDPARVFQAASDHGATTAFGSPTIWRRVAPWCIENGQRLPRLRRVLTAGAPVPVDLIREVHRLLPLEADVHTPYGATESLPVASIAGRDVVPALEERTVGGEGTCVGEPAPGIELRLIRIDDGPIAQWPDDLQVAPGEAGEVCVRGAVVSPEYAEEPDQTRLAKIRDADGTFWHRMGDVGRLDEEGRLWFLGRKSHRLTTLAGPRMPVPVENVFNQHDRVHRTALVGAGVPGREVPVLVVEPLPGELPRGETMTEGFAMQLRAIGGKCEASADVELFLFHPGFPVDVRHNAKIHREELKVWARSKLP